MKNLLLVVLLLAAGCRATLTPSLETVQRKTEGWSDTKLAGYYGAARLSGYIKPETEEWLVAKMLEHEVSKADLEDAQQGKIRVGMGPLPVLVALGEPVEISTHQSALGRMDVWSYTRVSPYGSIYTEFGQPNTVTFRDGMVTSWSEHR